MASQHRIEPYRQQKTKSHRRKQRKSRKRIILVICVFLVAVFFARPLLERVLVEGQESSRIGLEKSDNEMPDNPELEAFLKKYEKGNYKSGQEIKYTKKELEADFPQLMQWDKRWGFDPYGSSVIGITGCAPTTMAMVIVGLNGDDTVNPRVLADFSTQNGFYESGSGTKWAFFEACASAYGITCRELPLSEDSILSSVRAGDPVICGMRPGHFTTGGHFIAIVGEEDGKLIIHDPNNLANCEREWEYETIENEIKVLWSFSK